MSVLFPAIALAYMLGNRLSNEAAAVVAGALCGITASIPFSLALFIAASRNWGRGELARPAPTQPASHTPAIRQRRKERLSQPPIFVINPSQAAQAPYQFQPNPIFLPPNMFAQAAPREFQVVGDD